MNYIGNIEKDTIINKFYRKVISTTKNLQLVLMSILPRQEIGKEKHKKTQFIKVESGEGIAILGNKKYKLKKGYAIIIPPNKYHNIINNGKRSLKLYTIYSPPEHKKNTK